MNGDSSFCSDQRLRVLLDGQPREETYRSAAEHLETCASCQSRIAELAADQEQWAEVRASLATDEFDRQIELEQAELTWTAAGHRGPPAAWTDSMTRQLLSPPSHPEMLGRLGRYEIERLIGAGGMGVVFKGFDGELNRPVAIKVLAPHLAGSGAARQRFAREARAAAAIVHEHVVAIHNVESDDEPPFLVMQYVAGPSLQGRIDEQGPLTVCEVLRIARQTAAGLFAAHEQGLVHRDVKPSNILLERGVERALLTDFGLARASDDASLTRSGHAPGTPHYMSPEQARGDAIDHRSDLFSLGSVMYAMCTGRPPYRAETALGVMRRITDSPPRPIREINPEIPLWLCGVIERLHAQDPAQRYTSAAEVAELLGHALAHLQQPDTVPLPKSLAVLDRDSGDRGRPHDRWIGRGWARFCRATWAGPLAVLLTVVLINLVGLALAVLLPLIWHVGTPAVNSDRDPGGDSRTASVPPDFDGGGPDSVTTGDDPDPATSWDSAAQEIHQLDQQLDEFTSLSERLWDVQPTSKQSDERQSPEILKEEP